MPAPCLPLGEAWLDCVLVYSAGQVGGVPENRGSDVARALETYLTVHPAAASGTVWFDTIAGTCFSAGQFRGGPDGKDYSFFAERESFLDGMWGLRYIVGSIGFNETFRALPTACDPEYIISEIPFGASVKGARVCLVLGGPSTKRVRWECLETDQLWSCNRFYLSPRLAGRDLALIAVAPDVPLEGNGALHDYIQSHETHVAFEVDRGGPVGSWHQVNGFVARYPDRCGFFHTRYQSALGLGTRLLLLAVFLGASEIGFVGLDGMTAHGPLHAFEPYKGNPTWYYRYGPDLQRRQYVVYWEYVLGLRAERGFRLLNLGEFCQVNLSRTISAKHFPLPGDLRGHLR